MQRQDYHEVKARLARIGKTNVDLVNALATKGIRVDRSYITHAFTDRAYLASGIVIQNAVIDIIKEWERLAKKK